MIDLTSGQCGLCKHFGESHSEQPQLVQIRTTKQAPEEFKDTCGHPSVTPLALTLSADSGCNGFEAAA